MWKTLELPNYFTKRQVWVNKIILQDPPPPPHTHTLVIAVHVHVTRQESERSSICVMEYGFCLFLRFICWLSYRVVFFIFHFIHSICFSYILETVTQPSVGINKKRLFSTHSSTTLNSLGIAIEMVTLPIKSRPPATYQYDTPIWISMTDGCF